MRKLLATVCVLVGVLLVAAVAMAAENRYSVDGSTSPTKAGKKSKPMPVGIKFDYAISEVAGKRPLPVLTYSIRFAGMQVNTQAFPGCTPAQTENGGPAACPKKSIVGSGYIENQTGATANPDDRSIHCNAKLTVINSRNGKGIVFVEGSPDATDPREKCDIPLASPIEAKFVKRGNAAAMEFTVPPNLLHPLPTLDNAVVRVESTINRVTARYKGRKRGFFESTGGCVKGKRNITVFFTTEDGVTKSASDKATCRK
jgi:hypothetical protein